MNLLSFLNRIEDTGLYRSFRERLNRRLIKLLESSVSRADPGAGLVILEAACGSAYGAHLLAAKNGVSLSIGLDINLRLFKGGGVKNSPAKLVVGDIYRPPFLAGSFDLVWNNSSIEEVDDPESAVSSMAALAKRGGYVFVGVPYARGPLALCYLLPLRGLRKWLGRPYSRFRLKNLLAGRGLSVEAEATYLAGCFIGLLARKT